MTHPLAQPKTLIEEYTSEYMEKVFYFCIKKTGNRHEAEDLAQDISLNVLTQLRNGNKPKNFSAWVWSIARNRYSKWADRRHITSQRLASEDISDYELPDHDCCFDGLERDYELSVLRRELAFITSNYRSVMVAYYIEDKSISEIAAGLGISVDAVKKRLSRGRIILKEGMEMAREFGKLSYKPEDVRFITDGTKGFCGEPWTIVEHLMNKNILLAAYRNPSTAEDLAMELGIALPYMEDELERLVRETLLVKNGSKYEANLPIISAKTQHTIYDNQLSIAKKLTDKIIKIIELEKRVYEAKGYYNEGYQSFDDSKWVLLPKYADEVLGAVQGDLLKKPDNSLKSSGNIGEAGVSGRTIRPNGGCWELVGMENLGAENNCPLFPGKHGCPYSDEELKSGRNFQFWEFKYYWLEAGQRIPQFLSSLEGNALNLAARGKAQEADKEALERLASYGYLKKEGASYVPTILVTNLDKLEKRTPAEAAEAERLIKEAVDIVKPSYIYCKELITKDVPEYIMNRSHQIESTALMIYTLRGFVISEAMKQGYIKYEPDSLKTVLGAYMELWD